MAATATLDEMIWQAAGEVVRLEAWLAVATSDAVEAWTEPRLRIAQATLDTLALVKDHEAEFRELIKRKRAAARKDAA
jgi:hypothetical protein